MEEKIALYALQNQKKSVKRKNLNFLGLNKFIGMYLIIRMHLYCNKFMPFDFGIRSCELLFVSSGFLVGYNYFNNPMEFTHKAPFKYTYKHLRSFYPFYILNLFYGIYFNKHYVKLNLTNIELLLINLLLIANWSSHRIIARFYFPISWFLDNIVYCYFLSPFLLCTINNIKNSIKIFFFVYLSRIVAEEFLYRGAFNVFDTHIHCGPIIRIYEFYMGMLLVPLFFNLKSRLDKFQDNYAFKIIFTIIQIILPIFLCYIMIKYDKILLRCYFLLIICLYVFIISYDYGYLSFISSLKFLKTIMSTQLEMYLTQMNVHLSVDKYFKKKYLYKLSGLYYFYLKLVIIFIISFIYRRFYRDKFAKIMDKIIFLLI